MACQARGRRHRRRAAPRADGLLRAQTPRGHVWLAQTYMDSLLQKTPAGFLLVPAVPGTDILRYKTTLEVSKRAPRKAAPAPGDTREVRAGPPFCVGPLWRTLNSAGGAPTRALTPSRRRRRCMPCRQHRCWASARPWAQGST